MDKIISKQLSKGEYANNKKEDELLSIYNNMKLGNCAICQECRNSVPVPEELSIPVSAWCIGNAFYEQEKRILFVGKTARGNPSKICGTIGDTFADTREFLWWETYDKDGKPAAMPSAYWGYTAEITKRLYGIDSPEFISFTNIVKCNDSPDIDIANSVMKENCVRKLRVLTREIEYINPTHIIFYTGRYYDGYIKDVFDCYQVLDDKGDIQIGKRKMPWQEACGIINNKKYHVLRIGHPERKKKEEFVSGVVEWVRNN